MTRPETARRLTAAILAIGLFGALSAAQPPRPGQRPPNDPLAEATARQKVIDQKAEVEVLNVIQTAEFQAKANPVKAVQTLKAAQVIVDSPVLSTEARKNLLDLLQRKIAAIEGRPVANAAGPKADPNAASAKKDREATLDSALRSRRSTMASARRQYQQAGLTKEADLEIARLAKAIRTIHP